jgi:DNA repair exonuclease SbcCD ATPase subunit
MIETAQSAQQAGQRLHAAENLLEQAVRDLTADNREAPGARCATALGAAAEELRAFGGWLAEHRPAEEDREALRTQLAALAPRLRQLERLLGAAQEFYRGWCAAAPLEPARYESPACETTAWLGSPRPALLALRA